METRRTLATAVLAAALLSGTAACGGAAPAPSDAPPSSATAAAADPVATACENLLAIDAVPSPDSGPDSAPPPEAVQEFGTQVAPLLAAASAAAPPELAPSLAALQPFVEAAATQGTPPDFEDPALTGAITGYETWAHDNCGYQNVDLVGTDFRFDGAPTTLTAGPVSMLLENRSTDGQFHVALVVRPTGDDVTLEALQAAPIEQIMSMVEILPGAAAAAPGQTGGLLIDLPAGRYFLLCPVGDEGQAPHYMEGMVNEITVT